MQSETRDKVSSHHGVSLLGPLLGLFLGLCIVSVVPAEEAEQAAGSGVAVDFSGTWELNKELSDDPRKKREATRSQTGRGGGGGGRGSGLSGGRGGGGPDGGGGSGRERGAVGASNPEPLRTLRVEHVDPELVVVDANDRETRLYTDGRPFERLTRRGVLEHTGEWQSQGRLKIANQSDEDRSERETWELVEEGQQLHITVEFKGGQGREVKIRRVYDRVEAVEEMPQD